MKNIVFQTVFQMQIILLSFYNTILNSTQYVVFHIGIASGSEETNRNKSTSISLSLLVAVYFRH